MNDGSRVDVNVGFMPLLDCAMLVAAHETGIAASEGLRLRLIRETSWANIRDRLAIGHFDAAHVLGPMVMAETLGIGTLNVPLLAPVALGLGGNAITMSEGIWSAMLDQGAAVGADPQQQAQALARVIAARAGHGRAPLTLAMVFPFSCHNYQLREFLALGGIDPDRDVRLVVLPPPLLADTMQRGQIDGFCVGEPWNSIAVDAGSGAIVALACDLWPEPTEKVLGVRSVFHQAHPEIVAALVRSVVRAAEWIQERGSADQLAVWLAEPRYVGARASLLRSALQGVIRVAADAAVIERPGFLTLDAASTVPGSRHAELVYQQMVRWRQLEASHERHQAALSTFRTDIHAAALEESVI